MSRSVAKGTGPHEQRPGIRSRSRIAAMLVSVGLVGSLLVAIPPSQVRAVEVAPVATWTYPTALSYRPSAPFSVTWTETGPPTASRQSQWSSAPVAAGVCGAFTADGSLITQLVAQATFEYPQDVAFYAGDLYVADAYNNKIRKITSDGVVSTFAGSGARASTDGTGTAASFNTPIGLVFDGDGNLFVSDGGGDTIRKITLGAVVTTFAGSGAIGSTDDSRSGSVSTDDGGITPTAGQCYRLALTLADRDGDSAIYTSSPVVIATAPDAPVGVSATPSGDEVTISWQAPTADGWSPVNAYTATISPAGLFCTTISALSCTVSGLSDGTYGATVVAANSVGPSAGSTPSAAFTIDTMAPGTSTLSVTPRTGATMSGAAVPLTLVWSAATDPGGDLTATPYEIERSKNGGLWTPIGAYAGTSTSVTAGSSGTVRYRIRTVDKADNKGLWGYSRTLRPRLIQQSRSAVKFGGTWTKASSAKYSGSSVKYAKIKGRSATYTFTGRSIALVTTEAFKRGKVMIYVNGNYIAKVNLYRSSAQYRVLAWQKTWSSSKARTVKLVVVGTSGRPRVDLDAFVVVK